MSQCQVCGISSDEVPLSPRPHQPIDAGLFCEPCLFQLELNVKSEPVPLIRAGEKTSDGRIYSEEVLKQVAQSAGHLKYEDGTLWLVPPKGKAAEDA